MDLEKLIEQNKKFNVKFFRITVGDADVSINIDSAGETIPEDIINKLKANPELFDFIRKYNNKKDD